MPSPRSPSKIVNPSRENGETAVTVTVCSPLDNPSTVVVPVLADPVVATVSGAAPSTL